MKVYEVKIETFTRDEVNSDGIIEEMQLMGWEICGDISVSSNKNDIFDRSIVVPFKRLKK